MRYIRAGLLGLGLALLFGVATGLCKYSRLMGEVGAEARARAYAESIAVALNCALFARSASR